MKLPDLFTVDIKGVDKDDLHEKIISENIHRGKIFTGVISLVNSIFAAIVIVAYNAHADDEFHYGAYLIAYSSMVIVNIIVYFYFKSLSDPKEFSTRKKASFDLILTGYVTFLLTWGSLVTLMGQRRYGQIMVFTINMVVCSAVYYLRGHQMILPYALSSAVVMLALPFYQKSGDILVGHYVNLPVVIVAGVVISRMVYKSFCMNYKSRMQLETEIEKNAEINRDLAKANQQLRKLSVVDELTGLSNRRGFQSYIDRAYEDYVKGEASFSVIMMDIDYFKIYNDTYGHVAGDKVMQAVANQISVLLKNPMHYAARWGGEEFIYIAFHTGEKEIERIAEEIRAGVEELKIQHEYSIEQKLLTISLGVCTERIRDKADIEECIEQADRALYQAKNAGRNQVKKSVPALIQEVLDASPS